MPGAPAATHASTASRTLGTRPPRELRSVATLLTFTERRTISSEMFFHRIHDFLRPRSNLVLVLAFQHDAEQRLGSGVPHEQTALAVDARLDAPDDFRDCRYRAELHFRTDADVEQHLRVAHQVAGEVAERSAGQRHGPQDVERRAEAVAGK